MTNAQLFTAIGIPCLLILLGMVRNEVSQRDLKADLKADIGGVKSDLGRVEGKVDRLHQTSLYSTAN